MTQESHTVEVLDRLIQSSALSPEGAVFLRNACDPFPDDQVPCAGFPDADASSTVVIRYKEQASITAPGAGLWDCIVFNTPLSGHHYWVGGAMLVNDAEIAYQSTPPQAMRLAPLIVNYADAGEALIPDSGPATWTPANFAQQYLRTVPANLVHSTHRIVGLGFEVTNTTAEMYKQGSVTTGTIPQITQRGYRQFDDGDSVIDTYNFPTYEFSLPPGSIADAQSLPGSRTWAAAQGVYATCGLNGVANPFQAECNAQMVAFNNSDRQTGAAMGWAYYNAGNASTAGAFNPAPYDTSFAYFTGLSNETVLQVVIHTYVEVAPIQGDALLAMASPSAPYDVKALELYAHVMREVIRIVPVSENGLGKLFKRVVRVIAKHADPILNIADKIVPGTKKYAHIVMSAANEARKLIQPIGKGGVLPASTSRAVQKRMRKLAIK